MTSNLENHRSYSKIAQLYKCFKNAYTEIPYFVGRMLQEEGDINFKIPSNRNVISSEPDLAGGTALHIAALKSHVEVFHALLDNGADITIQNQAGRTALHCIADQPDVKKEMLYAVFSAHLSLGDPSNPCDKDGISHLHIACMWNHVDLVAFFLNSDVPVNMVVNVDSEKFAGYTPLHFAAGGCAIATIKLLLARNASSRAKNTQGLTPFHLLFRVKVKLMDSLITKAEKQARAKLIGQIDKVLNLLMDLYNYVDNLGLTRFHVACTSPNPAIAEYYLQQNIDIDQQVSMDSLFYPGYTALHFAAHCNPDIVRMLIQKKADVEVRDAKGLTPMDLFWRKSNPKDLHELFTQNWADLSFSNQRFRLVDLVAGLLDKVALFWHLYTIQGQSTSINQGLTSWTGRTPLHFAVMLCTSLDILKFFVECMYSRARDIDQRDCHGSTPIHLAFRAGKLDFVNELLKYSRSTENLVDNDGLSYLHIACARQDLDLVERYRHDEANLNAIYCGSHVHPLLMPGSTALHVAVASGHCGIIEALLRSNMDPQAEDANGRTPIHRLLRMTENVVYVCRALLAHGSVSDKALERFGLTRLHMAIYCQMQNAHEFMTLDTSGTMVNCDDPESFLHEYDGCTPLHMAIKREVQFDTIQLLLQQDGDLLALNHRGDSPLYTALENSSELTPIKLPRLTWDWNILRWILKKLRDSGALQKQLEKISGITMLHLACHVFDIDAVSWLLVGNFDIEARVKLSCPVWPGCTPLHVMIKATAFHEISEDFCDILGSMLEKGANVSALNENGETPINLVMRPFSGRRMYRVIALLVDNIKDYTVNPPGRDGMSHFHAACLVNNATAVKLFLENGAVDVNQPIDFFAAGFAGETPLHLVVEPSCESIFSSASRQATLDLLLEFGADHKAEDSSGLTVLHKAVEMKEHVVFLTKLFSYGARVDSRNIFEETPLELYMKSRHISVEGIKLFKSTGCRLNVSNPVTEEGYISILISERGYYPYGDWFNELVRSQCFNVMMDADDASLLDEMGRNLIHNIVTTNSPNRGLLTCDDFIKRFQSSSVDIDLPDKRGKTALHLAAHFGNIMAVDMLLDAGADVNVVDLANLTPLQYAMKYRNKKKLYPYKDSHMRVIECLVSHICVLQLLSLEVHQNNCQAKDDAMKKILSAPVNHDFLESTHGRYNMKLNELKVANVKSLPISNTDLRVGDFLSERGKGFIAYAFMSDLGRESVDQFFDKYKGGLRDVCARQYRRAKKRLQLVGLAVGSVWAVAKTNVPIDCIEMIFQHLTNDELDNFVKGTAVECITVEYMIQQEMNRMRFRT